MKLCALLIVAAVCAVLLPSDVVDAGIASPSVRALEHRGILKVAKSQLAKRDDDYDLAEFFESDFVSAVLDMYGITMEDLDELIEEDDEIEPEDRDAIKALTIMIMAGVDLDSFEKDSSEEDTMMD